MSQAMEMKRRTFIQSVATVGGALVVGFHLPSRYASAATDGPELNAWVHVAPDNTVTLRASQSEMGQGPTNGNLMMFAEEMECAWPVNFEFGSGRPEYINPLAGLQITGGSTATPGFWDVMRKAGAQTRHMLIQAAAKQWGVDAAECHARNSVVSYKGPGVEDSGVEKSATFGELAAAAAQETPPEEPELKTPDQFRLIGTATQRLDSKMKVTGEAIYGMDVSIPGMVVAAIRHAPFGAKIASYDEAAAMAVPGVHDVLEIGQAVYPENSIPCLIVTADTYWQAEQGLKAANPTFDGNGWAGLNSDQIHQAFVEGAEEEGALGRVDGDFDGAIASADKVVEAHYEVPYLSHSPMEPMNCLADYRGDFLEIWSSTQDPGGGYIMAEKLSGLPQDKIKIHVTFLGGGFGRRVEVDYLEQAVEASMKLKKPVKLVWSREEDMQNNFHRPAYLAKMTAGIDADGKTVAWRHRNVGPGIWLSPHRSSRLKDLFADSDFLKGQRESGVDFHAVQGGKDIGYDFANLQVSWVQKDFPVPIVFLRGVGNTMNCFFIESFLDEVAEAVGKDPYQLRRELLHKEPRMQAVLDLAAEKAGWGQELPKGHFQGMAFHNSFDTPFADVIEISVRGGRRIKVHKVVRVLDCGIVVNPDQVDAQCQSGLVWGLTMAMYSEHLVRNAKLVESNFDNYRLLRISQMPEYEVHTVKNTNSPTGIGEPVFHTVTPALVNALYAATGKRIRSVPLKNHGYSLA
jgi:isoquinoline 1-oxidoreductase beta subunit